MADDYFRRPKKVMSDNGRAWFYAKAKSIEIHVLIPGNHTVLKMTRRQLDDYIRRTAGDRK